MKKQKTYARRLMGIALSAVLAMGTLVGCGDAAVEETAPAPAATESTETAATTETAPAATTETTTETPAEPTVIRYGTHWVQGLDPNYVDDVTGEYTMAESERQAGLAGLQAVKEQLNVEFEFVQYAQDTRVELMTSVLAGDPVCEIANIWGGAESTILAQNVLQPLDDYASAFDGGAEWMLDDQIYGHYYLLSFTERFIPRWPLIYNATLIQAAGLEDPAKVFADGNWTWSTFKSYLETLNAYYANTPVAVSGTIYDNVQAYETDHRFAGLSAMYSNGGAIYGSNGLTVDSQESIDALAYVKELFDAGLMTECGLYDDGYTPEWCRSADDFAKGGSCFTDCPDWWLGGNGSTLAERGESMGIVPWPRADRLAADSDEYSQVMTVSDSVGILKGVDAEKTELAVKAYRLYWETYYKTLAGIEDLSEYQSVMGATQAASFGFDIYDETFGEDILNAFIAVSENLGNDYSDMLGMRVAWDDIFGKGLYGVDGMSSDYSVAVAANMSDFTNVTARMEELLASSEVHDNQAPSFSCTDIIIPVGTDITTVDLADYYTVEDSVDGVLDVHNGTVTYSDELDTNTVGRYEKAVKLEMADNSGNSDTKRTHVIVYNPDNTEAPVITLKAELPTVALDADASSINWADFLESAVDADGLDVSGSVTADLSTLDTSTPGDYSVTITVTDYAGNTAEEAVTVSVVAE